jgi:hypothetical protein
MWKAPKSLAHLPMREMFTTLESILAPLHAFAGGAFVELNVCAYRDCVPRQFRVA